MRNLLLRTLCTLILMYPILFIILPSFSVVGDWSPEKLSYWIHRDRKSKVGSHTLSFIPQDNNYWATFYFSHSALASVSTILSSDQGAMCFCASFSNNLTDVAMGTEGCSTTKHKLDIINYKKCKLIFFHCEDRQHKVKTSKVSVNKRRDNNMDLKDINFSWAIV